MAIKLLAFVALGLIVAAGVLALESCALGSVGDAVLDTGSGLGNDDRETPEEEFPGIRDNCRLPGAALWRQSYGWRLSLPAEIYAARESQPTAGRISCIINWARARRLNLVIGQHP